MGRGRFVALEGADGCGKSTQAARLAARLGAVLTREPGGTAVGERVRGLVLDPSLTGLDPRAEALLMAAARAQHVAEVIEPALRTGRDVVSDRFTASSLAYQGWGRGLGADAVAGLSAFATRGLEPDVYVLLCVPGVEAGTRARRRTPRSAVDRFESETVEFHDLVSAGFGELAAADPRRWLTVDGVGSPDEVEARVWSAVGGRLVDPAGSGSKRRGRP